ncbi:MAG: transporter [Opitutaceae bacterium]
MKDYIPTHLAHQQSARIWRGGMFAFCIMLAISAGARPTETDDTDTLEKGLVEIESGVEFEQAADGHEFVLTPAITYGLTNRLEVELGLDHVWEYPLDEPAAQIWKPAAKFKVKFWTAADGNLSLAFKGKIAFPVTVRGPVGSDDPEGYVRLLMTKLAGAWQYDLNVGYKYEGAWQVGGDDKFNAGAAVRYKVNAGWQVLAEVYAAIPGHQFSGSTALADIAVKYRIRDGLKVDLLVGTGLGRDAIDLRVVAGLKWEF